MPCRIPLVLRSVLPLWLGPILAAGAQDRASPVTVVDTVVDAACYLMHPPAADGPSHDECGKACALAGVPLGVVDQAGKRLYLADGAGTKLLLPHLHKRVRVSGRAVEKSDPLTLEMPVGTGNKMSVRLDGGYLALTVDRVKAEQARAIGAPPHGGQYDK
jgi:hypothetical protein